MSFDAIIIGSSFAGLSVARQLRGNILLIDKDEIGSNQVSACGTPLEAIKAMGAEQSILQLHEKIYLHISERDVVEVKWRSPFCTFDYYSFCRTLYEQSQVKFRKAKVRGMNGHRVITSAGDFEAPIIIDCSGWRRAAVGTPLDSRRLGYGIETILDYQGNGLHFYLDPEIVPRGVCWVFPCGDKSRFGVASYTGQTRLKYGLEKFLDRFHLRPEKMHGNFVPYTLPQPMWGEVFLVGDAAGQCPPFTWEGIRPALYFGTACGLIVCKIIENELSLNEGLGLYRQFVTYHRKYYRILSLAQWGQIHLPVFLQAYIWNHVLKGDLLNNVTNIYLEMFEVGRLAKDIRKLL